MTPQQYIDNIHGRYKQGNATEHTYRGDLQQLLESIVPEVKATNEPKRQKCGAPDYILMRKEIPVGFIEAKNIGDPDLDGKTKSGNKEQFDRYRESLDNIIFTDYLDFHLYQDGVFVTQIAIGEETEKGIVPIRENFQPFENLIKDFTSHVGQRIKSSKKLAEIMAGKARLLSDVIEKSLDSDDESQQNSTLWQQMQAFKEILMHDITPKQFADIYAQTITYGLFAARLNDPTIENFSRQEAAELIPKSNPFLRKLFGYIAGPDIDDRILWIVENLVDIFLHTNVEKILSSYGKDTQMEDPIIHFYEDFLAEYDPKLRKARGVWYTPAPVVSFIVRSVDEILKSEFGLQQGLADTTQTTVEVTSKIKDRRSTSGFKKVKKQVDKVQILDPAAGTGTFLAEVIKQVHQRFEGQEGIWSGYVEKHLIPRLYGFEILMASYAMAHLQLDLLLKETGFKATQDQRLQIYLTNSLEEAHPDTGTLFASWLSDEANEANRVKRDAPIMCVIGNPPYSVSSNNKGEWIESLIADYKRDLDEKSYNSLSDDYVKFIRYGQHFIDKNGEGILAFISNNSFIDGLVFRKMRENLLKSFDKIYILDLHGNSKKKETAPDGSKDENVFDIMQGVSINFFIKTGKKKENELGKVYHADQFGKRKSKYSRLTNSNIQTMKFQELQAVSPNYFYVPKNFEGKTEYELGFKIDDFFKIFSSGIETRKDKLTISFEKEKLKEVIDDFKFLNESQISSKYEVDNKSRDWKIEKAKNDILNNNPMIRKIDYKPFDIRNIIYTGKVRGINGYPMYNTFQHYINGGNIGLILMRKLINTNSFKSVFITDQLSDKNYYGFQSYNFPLYLYPDPEELRLPDEDDGPMPNFDPELIDEFQKRLGLELALGYPYADVMNRSYNFMPEDVLDYIYAVLHSPAYREKYKEFLKIDFPRVPYPEDQEKFWTLVDKGEQLRELHLLESPEVQNYITTYPIDGDNTITRKITKASPGYEPSTDTHGKVWINDTQYFDQVPLVAWEFYIGGYQPAQKWLKDRKGRTLSYEDIQHYQQMIVALTETDRLMQEIDEIYQENAKNKPTG